MPTHQTHARSRNRNRLAPLVVPRRVYPFLFFGRPSRGRDHTVWQVRDPICLPHLLEALHQQGAQYGETLLNMPPQDDDPANPVAPVAQRLGVSDALLVVTRFPLDDDPDDVKCILRGYTDLEERVLRTARWVFRYLNRKKMILQPGLVPFLAPGYENRGRVKYTQHLGARISSLRERSFERAQKPPDANITSAFLMNARLYEGGPRLVACFAMDHISTLAWSLILAHEHPDWLVQPGFTLVDLLRKEVPKRPTSLGFARDWRCEVVLQLRPQARESESAFWTKLSVRPEPSRRFGVRQLAS